MWFDYNLKRCPCCGELEEANDFKYSTERQEKICGLCFENSLIKDKEERDVA